LTLDWERTADDLRELDALLARARARPRREFRLRLEDQIELARRGPRRTGARATAAAVVTASLTAAVGAAGGISYAATAVHGAASLVQKAATAPGHKPIRRLTAGGDQYQPGFGFGDPNHNHDGPPGLKRPDAPAPADGGTTAPAPLPARPTDTLGSVVKTTISLDEQAHLWISVIDRTGEPLLLTQHSKRGGSAVGTPLAGPQTKFIQYAVLVPRPLDLKLRVPSNLIEKGQTYRIRIVAIDPQGNRSTVFVPFRP
jgi:hypothetical protein